MRTFLIDPSKCLQCCDCQIACKDEHCDNDWSPVAALQGEDQYWVKIRDHEVGTGARVKVERVPQICQQCADAPCMKAAKDGAAYRRPDGIVIIDPEKAKGQKAIMEACPYGAVYWNDALDIPQKCTMCAHLLDAGWDRPRCATACPTDAIVFVDTDDLTDENLYAPLERLHPEYGTDPQVAYVNLPKPFIGGEVYNADGSEPVEEAVVTAVHQVKKQEYKAYTDCFGEFDVTGLHPGFYTVTVEADGYRRKTIANIDAREAYNMGQVNLMKKMR